jgi:hypothetical protein
MKVTERARYKYHRWQYKREMAMEPPAPRKSTRSRSRRTWQRVTHPISYTKHRMHARAEAKPVPPPMTQADLLGGPIKRRYRHVRIRLSSARHNFTNYPIVVQILGILVVSAIVVGAFFGIKNSVFKKTKSQANVADALAQAQDISRSQVPGAKAGQRRVLVAGDYSVINLGNAIGGTVYESPQYEALLESVYGCTITNDTAIVAGKPRPYPSACNTWPATYADNAHFYVPDVSVLVTGQAEAAPQIVNGKKLRPGTPEFQQYLFSRLDVARKSLGGLKTPLVLVTPLCDLQSNGHISLYLANIGTVWRNYAKARPRVTIADPTPLMCPHGKPGRTADGKPIVDVKHGGYTKEGANALMNFLLDAAAHAKAS